MDIQLVEEGKYLYYLYAKKMMICNKEGCTGCGLCKIICPVNAIDMKADGSGFLYPVIDKSRCIEFDSEKIEIV